ncbi:TrmB family transcriptional regulator [Natrialba chahannaoensis JCM 10990]|uniref:TrmB family transcriptional regulator n=1 Tax=Natrialba chahannaoensis JCM 10990 TaxID=1227492 RepID=M0ARL5_9EURY|nr:helix-turn-helix domain-containing protein [Natrialba chahannaoensis]ELZ01190.1 TrmB family transcriptional regulator [Natrialba chahannaoensis JCM 10990]
MDDNHIELLAELGLSSYEARAYLALARHGSLTADEVATESDIPQGRIYDVLNSLVDRSLVRADDGRPRTYVHVESTEAVDQLLENRVDELKDKQSAYERTASAAADALTELSSSGGATGEGFATSALHDQAAQDLLLERFAAADDSIRITVDAVDIGPEWRDVFSTRLAELLETGLTVRLLASDLSSASDTLDALVEAGLQVREVDRVPQQRFIVIDGVEVCLEVVNPVHDEELLAVVNFRDNETARELAESFDELWSEAVSWDEFTDGENET